VTRAVRLADEALSRTSPAVLVLSHHAAYHCRRSGACCTAGWRIPVEPARIPAVRAAFGPVIEPDGAVLCLASDGSCVLFRRADEVRPARCALHQSHGHEALPAACRHFPRIYLHDDDVTRVTLSHYCPTAASLLFEEKEPHITESPDALTPPEDREGLDARGALPPLLRPDMLMDVRSYAAWESEAVSLLASPGTAEEALSRVSRYAEASRDWQPYCGPLIGYVRSAVARSGAESLSAAARRPARWRHWHAVARASMHEGLGHDAPPPDLEELDRTFVAARWADYSGPLRRYLAGRLFGSWVAYQGRGVRTLVASLACALGVLRVEAARQCAAAGSPLDASLLLEAVRQADLLLIHKADRGQLAMELARVEMDHRPAA
jgi:hypothetical protein